MQHCTCDVKSVEVPVAHLCEDRGDGFESSWHVCEPMPPELCEAGAAQEEGNIWDDLIAVRTFDEQYHLCAKDCSIAFTFTIIDKF